MPTSITIFKYPNDSCLWISNANDANLNQINTMLKREIKNIVQKREIKTKIFVQKRRNH